MYWQDEGYLLSKNNYSENSIIIEVFTFNHGKYSGLVYGGNSRSSKKDFQIGNKILINYKSKNVNKIGYFTVELIKPITPFYFEDKKRSICIVSASSILKILLPERQLNKKIYSLFENLLINLEDKNWIKLYILWELSLIKELGYEIDLINKNLSISKDFLVSINSRTFKVPNFIIDKSNRLINKTEIKEALTFNRNLLLETFVFPNKIQFPLSRNILEKYFS